MANRYVTIFLFAIGLPVVAQTIFIPDTNLRAWLNDAKPNSVDANGYCDTAAWNAQPPQTLYCPLNDLPNNSTLDMEGVQHLKMGYLQYYGGSSNAVNVLWTGHPLYYEHLAIQGTDVSLFSASPFPMPPAVTTFYCSNCGITQLPGFSGFWMVVENVDLSGQVLNVPSSVTILDLTGCQLTTAPLIPNVVDLTLDNNPLTSWANLPANLQNISAINTDVPALPAFSGSTTLLGMNLSDNGYTAVPALPPNLVGLSMNNNQLTSLPSLAGTVLTSLNVRNNPLASLPPLPNTLTQLDVGISPLAVLPNPLPTALRNLFIPGTSVTTIPPLPADFVWLNIFGSPVTQLPAFPSSMIELDARNCSALTCVPVMPPGMGRARLSNSGVTCLPNIPPQFDITFNTLGIAPVVCNPGISPCPIVEPLITGTTFSDTDGDGAMDTGENGRPNATVIAQPGDLLTASDINGNYALPAGVGSFSATGVPSLYEPVTTAPYAVTFTGIGQVDSLNHIGFQIIPNMYDLVTDVVGTNVRPGFNTGVWVNVNNVGTAPTSATVVLVFDPALAYNTSSVVPFSINANAVYWTTPVIVPGGSWTVWVELYAPPSLVLGSPVVQQATATPTLPDQTPVDNTYVLNDVVVGSFDPNDKRVEPETLSLLDVSSGRRVEYTVRFQNTGTFPAERVLITDTLSSNLQWATMRMLASSHANRWYVHNGVLHVLFENINLADSVSDEPGSHGFAKFSFAPSSTLVVGAAVENIANIYFDYNEPVITNEAIFYVETSLGVGEDEGDDLRVWPNPADDVLMVTNDGSLNGQLRVLDLSGRVVMSGTITGTTTALSVAALAAGHYVVEINGADGPLRLGWIKN